VIVAVQYFRPPFPERRDWRRDLERIKSSGIDAIQLWVTWGWVEHTPGSYDFADYDELVAMANDVGLQVVLSTIAEVQPFWIHREIPDSHMIDHQGRTVRSVARRENNAGLTPGGCTDNPRVRARMREFLAACAVHFSDAPNVATWDVWNENRWAVHASGHVCYCDHTLRAFRRWLEDQYGDLDGLNAAWRRRYADWRDVQPGTVPTLLYTETVEFQRFLTWRAGQLMAMRAAAIRSGDSAHPVTAHGVASSAFSPGQKFEQAVSRGNDWDHIEHLDGYGLSMYPDFFIHDEADFGARIEAVRSASGQKQLWISELEAAPTGVGFAAGRPVTGTDLQRWLWECIGHGADGIVLWQWYDECIGEESASFGLAGHDPHAEQRLVSLAESNVARHEYADVLAEYRPDDGLVGVLFDETAYHLGWAQSGPGDDLFSGSVIGYLRALERLGVAYTVLDSRHLDDAAMASLRLVICPAPLTMGTDVAERLAHWVRAGGHLLAETELGSYTRTGFYQYPADRSSAHALTVTGGAREPVESAEAVAVVVGDRQIAVRPQVWGEQVRVASAQDSGDGRWSTGALGNGSVMAIGTFAGLGYYRDRYTEFEDFVDALVAKVDARGGLEVTDPTRSVFARSGLSGVRRLVFCTNPTATSTSVTIAGLEGLGDPVDLVGAGDAIVRNDGVAWTIPVSAGVTRVVSFAREAVTPTQR